MTAAANVDAFELSQTFLDTFQTTATVSAEAYASAVPFPHVVLDGLLDDRLLDAVIAEFPTSDDPIWARSEDAGIQVKLRSNWTEERQIPQATRELVRAFNSGPFLRSLARLTGIPKLIADPYLTGGGLNCILPGGHLDVHCDGNWHDDMGVHRRLNAILYLNRTWRRDWGGELELWDETASRCVERIEPKFNRLVIFTTTDFTFHGHPEPLACPPGEARKSLILYYYTSGPRAAGEVASANPHRALWRKRGQLTPRS